MASTKILLLRQRAAFNTLDNFSEISDEDLDNHIAEILRVTPFAEESLVKGSCLGRGIFVPRQRVGERLSAWSDILLSRINTSTMHITFYYH